MKDDDVLIVSAESAVDEEDDGAAPYVQFVGWGDTLLRGEVSSIEYLASEVVLDRDRSRVVEALGWHAPTTSRDDDEPGEGSADFFIDSERRDADRLAVMTTRVLRDVFGVAHPAFLSAGALDDAVEPDLGIPSGPGTVEPEVEALAVFPRDQEHLLELVDQALTPYFGNAPQHDEDDDIPVVSGSALVFVRVAERMPAVQLFCCVVHDITDEDSAAFEVTVLNRDQTFLKFVLVDDRVMAPLWLPAYPFAPEHLRSMLTLMSETVDAIDDDLARRVHGRRTFEDKPGAAGNDSADGAEDGTPEVEGAHLGDPERPQDAAAEVGSAADASADPEADPEAETEAVHPAMMTLLQLDAESPGTLTPELVASVCGMDRDLILELITWNTSQEIAWRQARDQALLRDDREDADVCEHEIDHAEQMVNLLRRALRLVVEQQLGRDLEELGYAVARRHAPRGRRRERDRALPGLDAAADEPGLFDQP